jgi:hypothetical protein
MKYGVVSSQTLGSHPSRSLLAEDYVFSEKHKADELLKEWMKANPGFMHASTPAMKDLRARLEKALRDAYEQGQ